MAFRKRKEEKKDGEAASIEEAIQADEAAQAKADDVEAAKQDETAASAEAAPEPEPVSEPEAASVKAMPDKMPTYKVKEKWKGSLGGSVCILAPGKVINPRLYGGPSGIEKMKKAGVQLEEVK